MGNIVNVLNLLGWASVAGLTIYKFCNNPFLYFKQDITLEVGLLTLVQTFQIMDIVLILIGKSKGSLFGSIAQITGRLVVTWLFLEDQTNRYSFAMMAIMWSIADMVRYSYYISKNEITALARYHMFFFLYPLGVYAQMRVINDYIKRHASPLTIQQIGMIRLVQAAIILGTVFLYIHMMRSRSKHYSLEENNRMFNALRGHLQGEKNNIKVQENANSQNADNGKKIAGKAL